MKGLEAVEVEQIAYPVEGDAIRVCLLGGGYKVCATVSSHHLVPDKAKQLRAALQRLLEGSDNA